jgi:hypothetical protein
MSKAYPGFSFGPWLTFTRRRVPTISNGNTEGMAKSFSQVQPISRSQFPRSSWGVIDHRCLRTGQILVSSVTGIGEIRQTLLDLIDRINDERRGPTRAAQSNLCPQTDVPPGSPGSASQSPARARQTVTLGCPYSLEV